MAFSGEQLDRVSNIFFNINSAETNDEIQKIAQEVSPFDRILFQNLSKRKTV
jgi:peptidyl-dipeptidase Dcp